MSHGLSRGSIWGRLLTSLAGGAVLLAGPLAVGSGHPIAAAPVAAAALPAGTYCQGPQADQPTAGPRKVLLLDLENESASSVQSSADAPFQNSVLGTQCGSFSSAAMHSTTHPSEGNYFAEVSGLNPANNSGADAAARFSLSDCPPDSTSTSCAYGGGHFAATVPSLFAQVEQAYGTSGWKTYADDMATACERTDDNVYATDGAGRRYSKYVVRHNPAVYFNGIACATQDVPAGAWQTQTGQLYSDLANGTLPAFSFLVPNDIENGHDPSSVGGVTVAGGKNQISNIDNYLSSLMTMIQASPDYQSGNLVVMITYDEGYQAGAIPGEGAVGENCADPNVSPQALSCQVPTYIAGRYVPAYRYATYMNQFGLLAATQRILGLSPLLGHAGDPTTPDIVNGTADSPDPFNLAPGNPPPPPPPPSQQLLSNGGFESPLSGVSAYGSTAKPAVVTAPVHGGSKALQVSNANSATTGFNAPKVAAGRLTAGQVLTGSCWVQSPNPNVRARIRLSEGTSFAVIGETVSDVLPVGGWTQVAVTGTVRVTGDQMVLAAYTTNQIGGQPGLSWDDCSLTTGGSPPPPPPPTAPGAPTIGTATAGNSSASVAFTAPASDGGSAITGYTVTSSPGAVVAQGTSSPITVTGLTNGMAYTFTVTATNAVGTGPPSAASNAVTPSAPPTVVELLPDPGFEAGNGGWVKFTVGTLTRVTAPVHGGARALLVAPVSASNQTVGMTQNSVVSNSVAGRSYTASCYVQPSGPNLNVSIRFLEYTQNFSSDIHLQTTTVASVPTGAWTLVTVTSTAVNSGERMIPQIYSTNSTTATGSLTYDDCSVSAS